MTKRERARINDQADRLAAIGFTYDEAEALRRISMTLHRVHELECGTDSYCLVRGRWNQETGDFEYDASGPGSGTFYELAGVSGRGRYIRTPDRETGARRRLLAIVAARNNRVSSAPVRPYIQGDPRGAALYILRPGDVPDGKDAGSYYNRGLVVF